MCSYKLTFVSMSLVTVLEISLYIDEIVGYNSTKQLNSSKTLVTCTILHVSCENFYLESTNALHIFKFFFSNALKLILKVYVLQCFFKLLLRELTN